jgi:hypothetical protein
MIGVEAKGEFSPMARWRVQYQGPDKKIQQTLADVPDNLKTAREVQNAIEKGEIADLYISAGAIVLVQKLEEGWGGPKA